MCWGGVRTWPWRGLTAISASHLLASEENGQSSFSGSVSDIYISQDESWTGIRQAAQRAPSRAQPVRTRRSDGDMHLNLHIEEWKLLLQGPTVGLKWRSCTVNYQQVNKSNTNEKNKLSSVWGVRQKQKSRTLSWTGRLFCHQLGRAIRELSVPIKAPLKRADLQNDVSVVLRGPGRQLKTCWNWWS